MSISHSEARSLRPEERPQFAHRDLAIRPAPVPAKMPLVILIEPRQFIRDCLARGMQQVLGQDVIALSSTDEWLKVCETTKASLILLSGLDRLEHDELSRQAYLLSALGSTSIKCSLRLSIARSSSVRVTTLSSSWWKTSIRRKSRLSLPSLYRLSNSTLNTLIFFIVSTGLSRLISFQISNVPAGCLFQPFFDVQELMSPMGL